MGTYLVMKNNFKRSLNHKLLFTITFLLPVILCVIAGSIDFQKSSLRIGILGLPSAAQQITGMDTLYHVLEESDGIQYSPADIKALNTDLMTGKYQVVLDYRSSNNIDQFELLTFQKEAKKQMLTQMFQEALAKGEPIRLTGLKPAGLSPRERITAVLLSLFMIFSTIYSSRLIRDRQSGILLRYRFAFSNQRSYITGTLIHSFLISYAQIILCITVLLILCRSFTLTITEGIVISFSIALISSVFSMLICMGSQSELQANITASSLTAVLSLLGGTFAAVEAMPGLLKIMSFASPIRWVVELLKLI